MNNTVPGTGSPSGTLPVKAIETSYAGCRFRSRLEARWAVFFDALGIAWEYEKQGLAINGRWYQPGFLLEGQFWVDIREDPGHLDTGLLLDAAARLGFLMVLGPVPEPRENEYGLGDWGWSRVAGDAGWVNQYGFGTWYKDRRPWAHCDYVPPGPGWLTPVWCDSESGCASAYAAARSARFGYILPPIPASASPIEQRFWDAHARLTMPELDGLVHQHRVLGYKIDFALPRRKIGIELDGFRNHSKTADVTRDHQRQREIEAEGWRIIRFGGSEVHHDPELCIRQAAWLARRWGGHD